MSFVVGVHNRQLVQSFYLGKKSKTNNWEVHAVIQGEQVLKNPFKTC